MEKTLFKKNVICNSVTSWNEIEHWQHLHSKDMFGFSG